MLCQYIARRWLDGLARSERFELPTLGFEVRCSIQLSYERICPAAEICSAAPISRIGLMRLPHVGRGGLEARIGGRGSELWKILAHRDFGGVARRQHGLVEGGL